MAPEDEVVVAEPARILVAEPLTTAVSPEGATNSGGLTTTNVFPDTWVALERWARSEGFGAPRRLSADASPVYTVARAGGGTVTIRVGSQVAYWNGMELRLGFAPKLMGGKPYVHNLDVRKNLEMLANPAPDLIRPNPVIVLDPGHGGTDNGTESVYNGHFEKEYTLDVARRLQTILATNGWTVFLTRTGDTNPALSNRVAFAEQQRADLFLSLHFNSSAPDRVQAGLETYCLTPAGMPSSLTRGYADNAGVVFPNNRFDAQNLELAVLLHKALLQVNGDLDRGVRRARFLGVLQRQNRPAVLVEGGYLSNPKEAREIADPAYRQKMAEALGRVLVSESERARAPATQSTARGSFPVDGKAN